MPQGLWPLSSASRIRWLSLNQAGLLLVLACLAPAALGQPAASADHPVTLNECLATALLNNRLLQIERLNPEIARATLDAAYGWYDPRFLGTVNQSKRTESGGFNQIDLSSRPGYTRDEQAAVVGLTGILPSGLTYSVNGSYDHSTGTRTEEFPGGSFSSDFDSYEVHGSVSAQQPLLRNLWIDQGRMTIQVNKKNLKFTRLGVLFMTMTVMNLVQQAYYDLLFNRENLEVQLSLRSTRAAFLAGIRRQVQVGTRTLPDARLAEAQLAAVEADLVLASNLVVLAENALKTQLGDAFTNQVEVRWVPAERLIVVPQTFDLAASRAQGLAARPDLAQLREDVAKAEIDVRYRHNQLFPSLDLVASYGRSGVSVAQSFPPDPARASLSDAFNQIGGGDNPSKMIGLVLSLPLSRTAERGNYRASRQWREQTVLRVKQMEELVLREVTDACDTARTSLDRVAATRRATEAARTALEAEEQKLAGGKSDVFFVLQLQGNLAAAQTAEIRAKADYNKAVSALRFAEGSLLEQRRVSVEFN